MSRQPDEAVASDFAVFVCAHTPALLRAAYLLTGNAAAAEDLVQDTLLRLFAKWGKVQAADVPLAYVRRSMVNNFLNGRRRRAGNEVLFADASDDDVEPDFALAADDRSLVRALLAQVDPRPRAILVMRYLDDLSDDQIAAIVGCRPGTVRSTISRALATLRRIQADNIVMEERS